MLTEMSLKEALKYFMKGRKVLVLNEYDDKSISAERIEDCLPKEAKYLVDVPAVPNPEFEQAVQDMVEPDQNENDTEGDEQLPPDQSEKKLEKETVATAGKMSRKELKNPVKAEMIKSGDNSDRHKCRTCQYRHSDAGGCDYCIHTGKQRGRDVEVCDKAVVGERLTKK